MADGEGKRPLEESEESDEDGNPEPPPEAAKRAKLGAGAPALTVESLEGERIKWSREAVRRAQTLHDCIESSDGHAPFPTPIPEMALRKLTAFAEGEPVQLGHDARELADLLHLLKGADFLNMPEAFNLLSIEWCARLASTSREKLMVELGVICDLSEEEQIAAPMESILPEEGASHDGASLAPLLDVVENADHLIEQAITTALSAYAEQDITTWVRGLRELEGISKSWRAMVRSVLCSRCFKPGIEQPTEMDLKPYLFVTGLGLNLVADAVTRFPTLTEIHAAPFKVDVAAVRSLEDTRDFRDVRGCVVGEREPPCSLLLAAHAARYYQTRGFSLPENSFSWRLSVQIDLPAGIMSIDRYAFSHCHLLTTISLPASLNSIGHCAFSDCTSLVSIKLPDGLKSIGQSAFSKCTSLTSIILPATLTSIGERVFSDCTSLTTINLPNGVEIIDRGTFSKCTLLTSIKLPAHLSSIEEQAFFQCSSLKTINLPAGLESIGECAFNHCASITSIDLPAGLSSIRRRAFADCTSLMTINLPASLESIDECAFDHCTSLKSVTLPAGLKIIERGTFSQCSSLRTINLPAYLTSIGNSSFYGCSSLTSVNLSDSLTSIGEHAFSGCTSLTSINLPNSLEIIGESTFSRCTSLTSINLPSSLTSIDEYAFSRCTSLTSIDLPANLTCIRQYAFSHCTLLKSIYLPANFTSIGAYGCSINEHAFSRCPARLMYSQLPEGDGTR
mmetsp:Transcript_32691/g.75013  ORF Transcript_32691/g.75013 Transcript_32691/m.75013 type:complete len:734 (+) Transcript_32691:42-2243(+)